MSTRRLRKALPTRRCRSRAGLGLRWLIVALLGAVGVAGEAIGLTPVGSEFQVNTYTTSYQVEPSVAVDAMGNFVVVWYGYGTGSDTSNLSVQGQLFDAENATDQS